MYLEEPPGGALGTPGGEGEGGGGLGDVAQKQGLVNPGTNNRELYVAQK